MSRDNEVNAVGDLSADRRGPISAFLQEVPTTVVARSFGGGAVPLGLDRPLELRGGDRISPCGVPSALPLDWHPELLGIVASACRERVLMEEPWFTLPPLALDGEHGVGRTHVARQIARHAGLPFLSVDVSGSWGEEHSGSGRQHSDVCLPPPVIVAMAATGCANPVVLLEGADYASEACSVLLASMIDPRSSTRWVDEGMRAVIDLSHVNWLVSTDDADSLHPSLRSALETVELRTVAGGDTERFDLLAVSLLSEVMHDLGVVREDLIYSGENLIEILRARGAYASGMPALHAEAVDLIIDGSRTG